MPPPHHGVYSIFLPASYIAFALFTSFHIILGKNRSEPLLPENTGWRLENIVYIELLRRAAPLFYDIYYYKPTSRSKEVDFVVCEQGNVIELVQVAYEIDSPKTYRRETEALLQASSKLRCGKLTLVALTDTRDESVQGQTIHIYSAIDWLLNP